MCGRVVARDAIEAVAMEELLGVVVGMEEAETRR